MSSETWRILDLLPVVYTDGLKAALVDRERLGETIANQTGGKFRLEIDSLTHGTVSIEDAYDEALNERYILEKIRSAEQKKFNAVVIDCFGDPALDAARELVSIPILGAAQSACHLAAQISPQFSIINTVPEFAHIDRSLVIKYGLSQHLASIITIDIPVLDLEAGGERTVQVLLDAVKKATQEDGAQAVVFGCTGMSSLIDVVQARLKKDGLNVPVIEPLRAAVYSAVSWVLAGHTHSKEAFKRPREKNRVP